MEEALCNTRNFNNFLNDFQDETPENQKELLQKHLLKLEPYFCKFQPDKIDKDGIITFGKYKGRQLIEIINIDPSYVQWCLKNVSDFYIPKYKEIKSIAQSDEITRVEKVDFLKSVFENEIAGYKIKRDAKSGRIGYTKRDLFLNHSYEKENLEYQMKTISQTDKIDETEKVIFLKSAFEKANIEYRYKMLFEDCTLDIQNETSESQIELLKKLGSLGINQIRFIAGSNKIEKMAKAEFLNSAFKVANADDQFNMLFEDCLIDIQNETVEHQIELLQKVGSLDIIQIRFIAQSDKIEKTAKVEFLNSAFEKTRVEYQYKMLFEDRFPIKITVFFKMYDLLYYINRNNPSRYQKIFEKYYLEIPKVDLLRLWLHELNPNYDYLDFFHSSCQLTENERKWVNKKIKEYAKDERFQKFRDQIPKAELIEETNDARVYECKWRNLYYKKGAIQVFLDKATATNNYRWDDANEEMNLLTQEYFTNRRINDIIVTVDLNNRIMKITGIEDVFLNIFKVELLKKGTTERITRNSESQVTKLLHNVAARNQCINFLARQKTEYNVLDIYELVFDNCGSIHRDVSFLFSIPDEKSNVYLIWESAEFEKSKATHIFKCKKNIFETIENQIKDFIENNTRVRSRLNSVECEDLQVKQDLRYFCRVNHDNVDYQIWESRIREELPFLK